MGRNYNKEFKTLADSLSDLVMKFDNEGRLTYINPQIEKETGLLPEFLIGKFYNELNFLKNSVDIWNQKVTEVIKYRRENNFEFQYESLQEIKYYNAHLIPEFDEDQGVSTILAVIKNLTESKKSEGKYKTEIQRYFDMFEMMPAYLILLTEDYHVLIDNKFFRERFGKSNGRRCYDYLFNRTEPCENCMSYKVLETHAPHEWEWTGPDGNDYYIYDFPFIDTDGSRLIFEIGIDITDRKLAQEELKKINENLERLVDERTESINENQKKLSEIYSSMIEGLALHEIIYDNSGKAIDYIITEVNPAFEKITGLKINNIAGKKASIIYGTGEAPYLNIFAKVANEGKPTSFEAYFKPMEKYFTISVFSPGNGKFATVFAEITERKKVEESLHKQHEWLRTTLTSIGDAVLAVDTFGKISLMNPVAEELTGWKEEEAIGRPIEFVFKIINDKTNREAEDIVTQVLNEGKIFSLGNHISLISRNGNRIPIEDSAAPIKDRKGDVIGAVLVFHDVTAKRLAQEELRRTSEYLENLFNYANAPIICWNTELEITRFDHAFEKMTGYAAVEVLGKKLDILFPENTREESLGKIERTLNGKWEVVEIPIIRKDGEIRIALWNSANVYDAEGKRIEATIAQGQDITKRKKTENELRENKEQLLNANTLIEAVTMGTKVLIATIDKDFRYTFFNKEHHKQLRLLTGKDTAVGMSLKDVLADMPAELEKAVNIWNRALNGETVFQTLEFGDPDKYSRWFNVHHAPIRDANGNIIGAGEVTSDITEFKKMQDSLHESELKFRTIIETSNEGIITATPDGIFTYVNQKMADMLGYSIDEIIGKTGTAFAFEDQMSQVLQLRKNLDKGESLRGEFKFRRKDGSLFWSMYNSSPIFNDNGEHVANMAMHTDITEQKKAEELLHKQHEWLRTTLASIGDAVLAVDTFGKISLMNPVAEELTGWKEEEAIGRPVEFVFKIINDQTNQDSEDIIARVLQDGNIISLANHTFLISRRGDRIPIEDSAAPIKDNNGNIIGAVLVFHDVTAKRLAQEELRRTSEYLENLFNYANAPIICWNTELEITRFNHAFEKMTGYAAVEVLGKKLDILFPENTREESLGKIERTLNGKWEVVEIPIIRKDGEIRIALWNSANVYDAEGKRIEATIAQGQDITERKIAENILRDREENIRAVFDATSESIFMFDRNGNIVTANKTAAKRLNRSVSEIIGHHFSKFVPSEIVPSRMANIIDVLNSGKSIQFEDERNGIIFNHNFYPVFENDRVVRVVSYSQDITEKKKIENALRESELRFRLALMNAPVSVAVQDLDLCFTWAYNLRTIDPSEIIGKTDSDLFAPDDAPHLTELKRRVIETGVEIREKIWVSSNGKRGFLDLYLEPIKNESGKIKGIGIATIDLTQIKLAEQQIEHLASFPKLNPNPVIEADLIGRIIYCNDATLTTLKKLNAGEDVSLFLPDDIYEVINSINEPDEVQ